MCWCGETCQVQFAKALCWLNTLNPLYFQHNEHEFCADPEMKETQDWDIHISAPITSVKKQKIS